MLQADGRLKEAIVAYRQAIASNPDFADAHYNLGRAMGELHRYDDAIACYRKAIAVKSDYLGAYINMGAALEALNRCTEAVECLRSALAVEPRSAEAHNNLGVALSGLARYDEAIACLNQAITLNATFSEAHNNLGNALKDSHRYDEAMDSYRRAIALKPDYIEALSNLGDTLGLLSRYQEALDCHRTALAHKPDFAVGHSHLIFALDFIPGTGFAEHQFERREWHKRHSARFVPAIPHHDNDRDPNRKLRIGYVSADFKRHSAALVFGPTVRNHDRSQFDVVLYSGVRIEDELTQIFRSRANEWRDIVGVDDEALAQRIRDDRVDILVDLSGHSEGNRLLTFARKPAPVQITAWGHGTGTGVTAIDYLFADPVAIPDDVRPLFAETIVDLPCFLSYDVPAYAPAVAPLPALQGSPLTFGSLNRLSKISAQSVATWSRLMAELPGTRILIKDKQLSDPMERVRLTEAFAAHHIAEHRLTLLGATPHAEHLAAYSEVDIALDPFPQSGGVSTMEAVWMGVPVVAMLGAGIPGRGAASIMTALGYPDWVARSEDDYIGIAKRKAADLDALAALRRGLRRKMEVSPVGNPILYCRSVEAIYRALWQRYCNGSLSGRAQVTGGRP
jgi:predicted O-linked N-acetylglucosamine transferase (SPINDLY family)